MFTSEPCNQSLHCRKPEDEHEKTLEHGGARHRGARLSTLGGCVTVRPEQRAVLADPVMQFQGDPREAAQRQHVIENREGSFGGSSVQGGGCGCN